MLGRQERIETKLARRHLEEGALVLYDLTSSSYEGRTCPVAPPGTSASAKQKKQSRKTSDGLPIHSFQTLLDELAKRCRNYCYTPNDPQRESFPPAYRPLSAIHSSL